MMIAVNAGQDIYYTLMIDISLTDHRLGPTLVSLLIVADLPGIITRNFNGRVEGGARPRRLTTCAGN